MKKICLRQILKEEASKLKPKDWGDCKICIYDPENNQKCGGYIPIFRFYIKKNEKKL